MCVKVTISILWCITMEYHLYLVGFYKLQARYGLLQRPFCPTAGPLIHKPWGCGPSYRLDSSHIQFPNLHDKLRELVDHILYDSSLPNWSREASPQLKICLIRMNIFFITLISMMDINSRHGEYCFWPKFDTYLRPHSRLFEYEEHAVLCFLVSCTQQVGTSTWTVWALHQPKHKLESHTFHLGRPSRASLAIYLLQVHCYVVYGSSFSKSPLKWNIIIVTMWILNIRL